MHKKSTASVLFFLLLLALFFSEYTHTAAQTSASQTLSIKAGFNFVSFTLQSYLSPQKLMEVNPKITDIYLYNAAAGSFISASDGALSSIVPAKGYIVKASADTLLNTSGIPAGTLGDITLKSGFNLVGFSKSVTAITFSSLMNGYSVIKGMYKWNAASGSFMQVVRNDSGTVEKLDGVDPSIAAEQSYFINAANDTTLNYDGGSVIIGGQAPVTPVVKNLGMIVLSRPSIAAAISSSIDLAANVTVSAVYSDGSSTAVKASWSLKSGGGSLAGSVYTAPASSATAVLTATYSEGGSTKTADLTVSAQTGSYVQGSENMANSLSWKWTDPGSDSVKIESAGRIDITVSSNRAFNEIYDFNAPRCTKSVTGDFVMYVRGFPNPFVAQSNGLGLVVEDPNAVGASRTTSNITLQYTYTSGIKFASMQTQNVIGKPAFIDLHDIYFKLERIGNKFTGYARDPNVSEWTQVGETTMNLPATIDAGIILTNQSNPSKFSAYFTDFSIYSLNSTVSSQVSGLTLSKTSDTSAAGAVYDLSAITATASYMAAVPRIVTPIYWDVLIGSGSLINGKYNAPATSENDILRASYTENGVSVSALFKLTISGGNQIKFLTLAERTITQAAAETVVDVNAGSLPTDIACNITVPANTLPAGSVVTIGKAESPAPMKTGIDQSKMTRLMPDVVITAKSSQGAAVDFSGPVYFDIPVSRLGTDSSRLLITCYDGKDVKYLTGRVTGDKFRVEIDAALLKKPAAAAYSSVSPGRQVILNPFDVIALEISIYEGIASAYKTFDDLFNTEDPGLINGSLSADKQNVLIIHGIFSQTKFLGSPDKSLKNFLTDNGYNVLTFNYKYWESNFDNGVTLAQRIMALTNDKMPFTIVCHSMGGLVTRWALNYLAANGKSNLIEKVVFLSTPNRGGKMGSKNLGEWQEYLNSGFYDAALLYKKFGLTKEADTSMAGFYFSSNLDNWPVGFLQLIGDKYDNLSFLASLNKYIAGRDYLNTSYYAMIDNNDEFVDVESIDFNSYSKTDKYPYSQCENFKNKNSFSLIAKNYEPESAANHSSTHNIALAEVSKDLLNFVQKLKSLSVAPLVTLVSSGGTLDLNSLTASAIYYNKTEQVSPQWEIKSGGGKITSNGYVAPSVSAPGSAVLIASYTDKDILKTTEVYVDIVYIDQNLIIDIGGGVTMEFVKIKAGSFTMGTPDAETVSYPDEKPAHQVTITKDFYMGIYEVTQKQWTTVMGTNPSPPEYGFGDNYPVHKINSSDCFLFVSKLNAKALGKGTFKLPTEAQWEYACRAGTTTPYYFGTGSLDSYEWYSNNSKAGAYASTHIVGQKPPNAFRLYDMSGNVSEFCSDMYAGASFTADPAVDPAGESGASSYSSHVLKGGNYTSGAANCRSAERSYKLDEANSAAGSIYGGYGNGVRIVLMPVQ